MLTKCDFLLIFVLSEGVKGTLLMLLMVRLDLRN
jgi:hypothetical protein